MNAPVETFALAQRRPAAIRRHLRALRACMHQGRLAIGRVQYRLVLRLLVVGDEEGAAMLKGIFDNATTQLDRFVVDRHTAITEEWARAARAARAMGAH